MQLTERERRIVRALGQCLFPRTPAIDVDAEDVGFTSWVQAYLGRMPPAPRAQIRALLLTFDAGFAVFSGRVGGRFASASRAAQQAYVESWSGSGVYAQRMAFEALWAMATFAYVGCAEAAGVTGRGAADAHCSEEAAK